MKKILIKRLVYSDGQGNTIIGAEEYSGHLDDFNILCAIHENGKTTWIDNYLWALHAGVPAYRISVESFYQYQKRWYENVFDALRRI